MCVAAQGATLGELTRENVFSRPVRGERANRPPPPVCSEAIHSGAEASSASTECWSVAHPNPRHPISARLFRTDAETQSYNPLPSLNSARFRPGSAALTAASVKGICLCGRSGCWYRLPTIPTRTPRPDTLAIQEVCVRGVKFAVKTTPWLALLHHVT